ncbi:MULTISPECIES: hypothetical protein [Corallococcus]|uniref:hypothetical protein n=1 Tax=Corallococcus TaxID=83461 RepID=UPI00118056FE|nr:MULTISPECIES: hypothetical protein [Corallococcus]NBD14472.1 hypothetical protein [Corallococcus silvisoli]TSC27326.1 hypothetical protein FOF48_17920 [Corallococcus sp. Z5C101001]
MHRTPALPRTLAVAATLLSLGCGDGTKTEAERRTFGVTMTSTAPTAPNEYGWTVTPEAAQLSVGSVRFYEGRVLLSRRAPRFDWYSLIGGTANAHPGHYVPGDALGEVLNVQTVDLLTAGGASLGDANAVTGSYGSLELTLATPTAATDAQNVLGGHQVHVRGSATHASGATVRFDATVDLPKAIEGVRFERELKQESGFVRIAVDFGKWMDRIDFATASPPDASGVSTFPADSQAQNGLVRGVEDTSAYVVTWVEGAVK